MGSRLSGGRCPNTNTQTNKRQNTDFIEVMTAILKASPTLTGSERAPQFDHRGGNHNPMPGEALRECVWYYAAQTRYQIAVNGCRFAIQTLNASPNRLWRSRKPSRVGIPTQNPITGNRLPAPEAKPTQLFRRRGSDAVTSFLLLRDLLAGVSITRLPLVG